MSASAAITLRRMEILPCLSNRAECRSCWRDGTGEEHHCKAARWLEPTGATEQRRAIGRTRSVQSLLTGLPRQVHAAGGSAALNRSEQDVTRLTEPGRQKCIANV